MADQLKLPSSFEPEPEAQSPSDKKSGLPPSFIPDDIKVSDFLTAKGKAPKEFVYTKNQQHPDLTGTGSTLKNWYQRGKIKNFGEIMGPQSVAQYLQNELGFKVKQDKKGLLFRRDGDPIEKKSGKQYPVWYRVEKQGGWPELSDVSDVVVDVGQDLTVALLTAAGALGGSPGGPVGMISGGIGAGVMAETGTQALREEIAKGLGFEDVRTGKEKAADLLTDATVGGTLGALPGAGQAVKNVAKGVAKTIKPLVPLTKTQKVAQMFEEGPMIGVGRALQAPLRSPRALIEKVAAKDLPLLRSTFKSQLSKDRTARLAERGILKQELLHYAGQLKDFGGALGKEAVDIIRDLKRPMVTTSSVNSARDRLISLLDDNSFWVPAKENLGKALAQGRLKEAPKSLLEQAATFSTTAGAPVATVAGYMGPLKVPYITALLASGFGKILEAQGYRWLSNPKLFRVYAQLEVGGQALKGMLAPLADLASDDPEEFKNAIRQLQAASSEQE